MASSLPPLRTRIPLLQRKENQPRRPPANPATSHSMAPIRGLVPKSSPSSSSPALAHQRSLSPPSSIQEAVQATRRKTKAKRALDLHPVEPPLKVLRPDVSSPATTRRQVASLITAPLLPSPPFASLRLGKYAAQLTHRLLRSSSWTRTRHAVPLQPNRPRAITIREPVCPLNPPSPTPPETQRRRSPLAPVSAPVAARAARAKAKPKRSLTVHYAAPPRQTARPVIACATSTVLAPPPFALGVTPPSSPTDGESPNVVPKPIVSTTSTSIDSTVDQLADAP